MNFFIIFITMIAPCYSLFQSTWTNVFDNSTEILPITPDDDIFKCTSYTGTHIDILHWINEDFSDYKDCRRPGLYTFNRRDRNFKVEIDVQRSWIAEISAIIFNDIIKPICGLNSHNFVVRPTDSCENNGINVTITETNRFETLSLYYDVGNLTLIITHNKQGEPLHFNVNMWQRRANINDSYGLCTGSTCNSDLDRNLLTYHQRSSYPDDIILLICDIYIGNYLNSTGREPWERSIHYNRTIENARKACMFDVQQEDKPHAAAGSLEVLFVEEQVNSKIITTIADVQINYLTNLDDKLSRLAETMDLSRKEVDDMIARITTTTSTTLSTSTITGTEITSTYALTSTEILSTTTFNTTQTPTLTSSTSSSTESTTRKPNNDNLGLILGCSIGGVVVLVGLIVGVYCFVKKSKVNNSQSPIVTYKSDRM